MASLSTAYVVLLFEPPLDGTGAPVFIGADVFSEPDPTIVRSRPFFLVELCQASAMSYEKAKTAVLNLCEACPSWRWVLPHLKRL